MLSAMSSALMHQVLSVKVAPDPKKIALKNLLAFFQKTFPQLSQKEKQRQVVLALAQLLETLNQDEITVLIRHSANLDILLSVKEKVIDLLYDAGILDDVRVLFTDNASIIYSNEKYFQRVVEFLAFLKEMNLLTMPNIGLFFSSNKALECFAEVKMTLKLMQEKKLNPSQDYLWAILTFPNKTKLITSLLKEREENDVLRATFSEGEFCGLILQYFKSHKEDIMTFGFKCYLAEHQKSKVQENARKIWLSAHQSLEEGPSGQYGAQNTYRM